MSDILVRKINEADAEAFLRLCGKLDRESTFMLLEPNERSTSVETQRAKIKDVLERSNCQILVAEANSRLIGYVSATGGAYRRNSHKTHIVIGIPKKYTGQGFGGKLLTYIERWAKENNIHRLELTVMKNNLKALRLYHKSGFHIEGEIKDSLLVAGEYVDEFAMFKII